MSFRPDQLREVASGIFYPPNPEDVVSADDSLVAHLKDVAASIPLRRARLCAHPDSEAIQQDMLIVSHRDTYVCPHRHLTKAETMLVIEGLADVYLFGDSGELKRVLGMGPLESGRTCFYRMPHRRFHGLRIESEFLTFVESTRGPFRPAESEDAPWAPPKEDIEAGRKFLEEVARKGSAISRRLC